jgi:23S rRNA pseudouridine2457 synthase
LLLLSDTGPLIKRLTDPRHHVEKTYWVLVEGNPTDAQLATFAAGIDLKDFRTRPAAARVIPTPEIPARAQPVTPHGPTAWLEIKIHEGKKRQIRHMTAAVGLFTLRVVRVAIGGLRLGSLAPGAWRELDSAELSIIFEPPQAHA